MPPFYYIPVDINGGFGYYISIPAAGGLFHTAGCAASGLEAGKAVNQLTNTLHALGVNFILGGCGDDDSLHKRPARLLAALASSDEARLRLSLIPLFLQHPEFAVNVWIAATRLAPVARLRLQCYYSAAVWLRQKYQPENLPLPDHFSAELGLHPATDPDENLRQLASCHAELSGMQINWLDTYQHAAQVWLKGLEYRGISGWMT